MRCRNVVPTLVVVSMLVAAVNAADVNRAKPPNTVDRMVDRMIVHEWGTFTELQDEQAVSLRGVNVDDEPVPDFVHGFASSLLVPQLGPSFFSKGLPPRYPRVVMRLETPVIYFYPPTPSTQPIEVDVEVSFRGGWLSEFYPRAEFEAPGLAKLDLKPSSIGRLRWENLMVATDTKGPATDQAVWLTPRQTDAAMVTNPQGESEHFLFYRGVGNFPGPLRVMTDRLTEQLFVKTAFQTPASGPSEIAFPAAWLAHVRADQTVAFQRLAAFTAGESDVDPHLVISSKFEEEQYAVANLSRLKADMHAALVQQGLFAKEATAMLETWNNAYFKSPGLRVFYLVPEVLVNERMPLTVSVDSEISRVMVGRVELISDQQRRMIEQLKRGEVSSPKWMLQIPKSKARNLFFAGRSDFGELGVEIPADYQRYLDLGRFRNALIRAEHRLRPTDELQQFVTNYRLQSSAHLHKIAQRKSELTKAAALPPAQQEVASSRNTATVK